MIYFNINIWRVKILPLEISRELRDMGQAPVGSVKVCGLSNARPFGKHFPLARKRGSPSGHAAWACKDESADKRQIHRWI